MNTEETITINILVGRQTHQLKIPRGEEAIYRKAAERINSRLALYQQRFPNLGIEHYLSHVLLEFAIQTYQLWEQKSTAPFCEAIIMLTEKVEEALQTQK